MRAFLLILITFASFCLLEGIFVFICKAYEIAYFDAVNPTDFAAEQMLWLLIAIVLLKIYDYVVRGVNAESDFWRKLFIALLPAAPVGVVRLATSQETGLLTLAFVYSPPLIYSLPGIIRSERKLKVKIFTTVAVFLGVVFLTVEMDVVDCSRAGFFLFTFFLNCMAARFLLFEKKTPRVLHPRAGIRARNVSLASVITCLLMMSFYFFAVVYPKSRAPYTGLAFTPDWSPHDNRVVITGYKISEAYAFGEPEGKALIYNADRKKVDSIIPLPGIPSKYDLGGSLLSLVTPVVVWTWEKDRLFYLKNGNEGVLFNADGTGFETIFKLPDNQMSVSPLMISPKRTKIFFVAYERKLKLDKLFDSGAEADERIKTIAHPYIVDLKNKMLTPFKIKGFRVESDDMYFFRYGFTGWYSEDVLALSMPDCNQICSNDFLEAGAEFCGGEKTPKCPVSKKSYSKIFVGADGTCLGNFPVIKNMEIDGDEVKLFGDGERFIYITGRDWESDADDGKPPCIFVGSLIDRSIEKTSCVGLSNLRYDPGGKWETPVNFSYQFRAIYDSSDWIWVRAYDFKTEEKYPRLLNYKTGELNKSFPISAVKKHDQLCGLPSSTGEYHLLSTRKAPGNNEPDIDLLKYKLLFDIEYYDPPRFLIGIAAFDIFNSEGELIGSISTGDFKFE